MSTISIKNGSGVELYKITTNPSGQVTNVTNSAGNKAPIDPATLKDMLLGMKVEDRPDWTLDKLLNSVGDASTTGKSGTEKESVLAGRLTDLVAAIKKLEQKVATAPASQKAQLQQALSTAKAAAQQLMNELSSKSSLQPDAKGALDAARAQLLPPGTTAATAGKAQVTSGGAQPQTQAQGAQAGAAPQQAFPGAGKAQVPGQQLDVAALMQSNFFQTANLNSLDQLGKTQMDQKKMMMLFMYFAMQAMSGDIGAMTAFMQFISTIILKDKSMQNVNMANKLIELEDNSRKATDQLLNTASYDPNNPQVAADFQKVMERTKADQGSIATSQKLIAQMMEEFAQVSEFLNNLQKSLLDVRGRLLSRMSSFNA